MIQPVRHPSRAVLRCEQTDSAVTFFSEYGALRLEPVSPEIVRVRFTREEAFSGEAKPGVLPFPPFSGWELNEAEGAYTLLTDRLALTIDKTNLSVCYRTRGGKLLLREKWCNDMERAVVCAMIVEQADPCIPQPNLKMNSGLSTQFTATATSIIIIDFCGYPEARSISLRLR